MQFDYLLFLYGTTYILLALQGHALHRLDGKAFPWRFLSLFALTHAAGDWLELASLSFGELPILVSVRLTVLAVSFFFVTEFGRKGIRVQGGRVPGRWILLPIFLPALVGILAGFKDTEAVLRFPMGFVGGLGATWALWKYAMSARKRGGGASLHGAAAAMALLTLAAGLIVPAGGFFPASFINAAFFQKAFGFPVQILRAALILVLVNMLFGHFRRMRKRLDPRVANLRYEALMMASLAATLTGGWIATETIGRNAEESMRRQILENTRIAASMVDGTKARDLRWSEEDLPSRGYRDLKDSLMALRASNHNLRFASLMGLRGGRVYILADSEPPWSGDYSPPGQWYEEVTDQAIRAFTAREELVLGPVTDRWGTWISAMVPVVDTADGGGIFLDLDIEAGAWRSRIAQSRLAGITFSLLLASIVISLLIVLQRQQEVNAREVAALQRMHDQRSAVLLLATSDALVEGDFSKAARFIDETAARTLGVERVGVWLIGQEQKEFRCVDLFQAESGTHGGEPSTDTATHPRYFQAMETGRVIDASDARTDARTAEFRDDYLVPHGIVSTLDAPIRMGGRLVGSVCFERGGLARQWTDDEVRFAGEVADQAAQALMNAQARRDEEERRRLEEQMRHSQKLESLGAMAGGIAHDFNNLLMGIQGNAELAMADVPASSPAGECLSEVQKTTRRAAELCQQMLAFAGRSSFTIAAVDLNALASEMARILEASISKKTAVRFLLKPELPSVEADATSIRQIVMNLVTNASEAMEDGNGTVVISTGCMDCDAAYLAATWLNEGLPEGRYVFLQVEDDGCGMDAGTQARIFDPFFTTKFQGRGLGLAAVLGIVRAHRGAIKVESAPGRGTSVRVLLPAGSRAAPGEGAVEAEPQWRGSGTILFVDDDPGIRTLGRRLLERIGFSVLTAADGRECLEIYGQRPEEISCIILDLSMPVMDGAEALGELRRIRADVRVILSSGYGDEEIARRFMEAPPAGFIQKPYRLASLVRTLRTVLEA